jgi:hypothetical protein
MLADKAGAAGNKDLHGLPLRPQVYHAASIHEGREGARTSGRIDYVGGGPRRTQNKGTKSERAKEQKNKGA